MNRTKYVAGIAGLVVGFAAAFLLTQSYNRSLAGAAPAGPGASAAGSQAGAQGQQGMMANVAQTIEKAKNNPNDFAAQVGAAQVYDQIGRADEVIEYLKKAYEIDRNKSAEMNIPAYIGQFYYFEKRNYLESESWFRRSLETKPDDPNSLSLLGASFLRRDPPDPDKALQSLGFALKIEPKSPHGLGFLIEAHLLKKNARGAEDALSQLKQAEPANKNIAAYEGLISDLKAGRPVSLSKLKDQ